MNATNRIASRTLACCLLLTGTCLAQGLARRTAEILRAVHPSFLGAVGTGRQLAEHAPAIVARLRATRQAIHDLGRNAIPDEEVSEGREFSFLQDPADRRKMIRHLNDLAYLVDLMRDAWDDAERREVAGAIRDKVAAIDALVVRWTGRSDRAPVAKFVPDLSRPWQSRPARYGDIHFDEGWYGKPEQPLVVTARTWDPAADAYVVEGTWGHADDGPFHRGGFRFTFTSPSAFAGCWWRDTDPAKTSVWHGRLRE